MRRLRDYLRFASWNSGLGYVVLWAVTFWALGHGKAVFGNSGSCRIDEAKILFYWVCDPATPLSILASAANAALTVTVWAPVYIAAATVRPDAIAIALPIVLTHLIGLPTAILVTIRLMLALFQLPSRVLNRKSQTQGTAAPPHDPTERPTAERIARTIARRPSIVGARTNFGLRGNARG